MAFQSFSGFNIEYVYSSMIKDVSEGGHVLIPLTVTDGSKIKLPVRIFQNLIKIRYDKATAILYSRCIVYKSTHCTYS